MFEKIVMKKIILLIFLSILFQSFTFCQTQEELDLEMEEELNEVRIKVAPEEEKIFKVVEDMPRFPGCEGKGLSKRELKNCSEGKMLEFIYRNIRYPKKAREEKTEGRVILRFLIERDLSIGKVKILTDIGNGCGEEAKRVILLMNEGQRWIPGKSRGKPVRVWFTIPVSFKLQG
ncbi:MAG: protein TonB [Granulosicoccus sp.]